jgi:16S rRNA (guanine527-N7)-methyltransferase
MSPGVGLECSDAGLRLNALLAEAGEEPLSFALANRFADYLGLLLRWNARMNLTSVRDEEGMLRRHFVESIMCARTLPRGIASLLDFGSGAGFPGIPIALCQPEIAVTLAESQGKKAAFLQEAVRVLELQATVRAQRAETLSDHFDCVTLRAVDRMAQAVHSAGRLVALGGFLALMTTGAELEDLQSAAGSAFSWAAPVSLAEGSGRVVALGARLE